MTKERTRGPQGGQPSRQKAHPHRRPATADDVARLAGVSRSAVSRTFTEGASVAPATRTRVLAAARTLKYRPNLFARSLMTRRSHILGLAVSGLDNQYYPAVVQHFSEELAKAGYRLLLFVTHGGDTGGLDPLVEELLKYRLDALILASSSVSAGLARECSAVGVPVIMFNNVAVAGSDVSSVAATNVLGGRTVAAYLAAAEHRHFAYIAGWSTDSTSSERELGFTTFLQQQGYAPPARAEGRFSFDGACTACRTLLRLPLRPDAMFCANDHMALAALEIARTEFSLEPGRDISIIGFDDAPVAAWPSFRLTTYSQPIAQMVARTISLLQSMLEGRLPQAVQDRLPGELIVRDSARIPPTGVVRGPGGARVWRPRKPLE